MSGSDLINKNMETIIGLLVVLLPVIFKLIGKKLEAAAAEQQKQVQSPDEWAEVLRRHMEQSQDPELEELLKEPTPPAEIHRVQNSPKTGNEQGRKMAERKYVSVKPSAPILQEEEKKPKEKIDPKKLIVYSEIMRPKCND